MGTDVCRYDKEKWFFCNFKLQVFPHLWKLRKLCGLVVSLSYVEQEIDGICVSVNAAWYAIADVFCHWGNAFSVPFCNLPTHFWQGSLDTLSIEAVLLFHKALRSWISVLGFHIAIITDFVQMRIQFKSEPRLSIYPHRNSTGDEFGWIFWNSIDEDKCSLYSPYLCLMHIIYFVSLSVQAREWISVKHFVFPLLWLHWRQRHAGGTHTLLCISTAVYQSELKSAHQGTLQPL